jgi:hypothetical protein
VPSSDVVLSIPDVVAVPQDYDVPAAQEIVPKVVTASFDGSAAAAAFLPTVEILAPSGAVVCRAITSDQVAAGASADVSFFHLSVPDAATAATSEYQQTVLATADLRSYWPLDETGGATFFDLGPSANDLGIVGAVVLGQSPLITTGKSAIFSCGFVFPSAQEYAISAGGYGFMPNDGSITVEAWINTTFNPAWAPEILSMDDNNFRLFQFRVSTTGKLEWISFDSGDVGTTDVVGATSIRTGTRRYVVGTLDGTSLDQRVYVDGVLDGSAVCPSARWVGNTPKVTLAARQVGAFVQTPIAGTIDEVAFYSRALSAAEVAAHYAAGIGA